MISGRTTRHLIITISFILLTFPLFSQNFRTDWKIIAELPSADTSEAHPGLAGHFTGISNNILLIAGGANFPYLLPWEGGEKVYHDNIYALRSLPDGNYEWITLKTPARLKKPVAYGASVTLPEGVICIGGENANGKMQDVFLMTLENDNLLFKELPRLPEPLTSMGAALIGNNVYVAGGIGSGGAVSSFYSLDIYSSNPSWKRLPDMPSRLSHAVMVAQTDGVEQCIFIIGGRVKKNTETITTFLSDVYRYSPVSESWNKESNIVLNGKKDTIRISAAAGFPLGSNFIVIAGGDNGVIFNRTEKLLSRINDHNDKQLSLKAHAEYVVSMKSHPGFYNSLLVYNTITKTWHETANIPGYSPVNTTAVNWNSKIILPSGEIKPGIRTPRILSLEFSEQKNFGYFNYSVLIIYFILIILMGFLFMKRKSSSNDFFFAGGRIPWWAAGISIFSTTLSAITFISMPAKAYATNWTMFLFNMTIILIVPVIIRYYLPFFRRLNLSTAYEYLEHRFSIIVRFIASGFFMLFMLARIAIVLFLPSLAINAITGMNVYYSILLMGIVTIIYCTLGGIKAVIWADVIQGFILVSGAIIALAFLILGTNGGLTGFFETGITDHKFKTFIFSCDFTQTVFWVVIFGGLANTLITYTSDQSVIQRYMSTKNEKAASKGIWLNGIISVPVTLIFFLIGTALYTYYKSHPHEISPLMTNIDTVFPYFITTKLPPGIAGLLLSAIFAAGMSTLSSNINSVSAAFTNDYFLKIKKDNASEKNRMFVARTSGIFAGIIGTSIAIMLATLNITSMWDQFNTFLGLFTSGIGSLFAMGIFFRKIGTTSALTGLTGSVGILILLHLYTNLSVIIYGFIGFITSIIISLLASVMIPNKKVNESFVWSAVIRK